MPSSGESAVQGTHSLLLRTVAPRLVQSVLLLH
jgi:hypothetical protein